MFCPVCGTKREDDGMFCADCGNQVPNKANIVRNGAPYAQHSQAQSNAVSSIPYVPNRKASCAVPRHIERRNKVITKKAVSISIAAILLITLGSISIVQLITIKPLNEDEIVKIASGRVERGMAVTGVSIDRRETDGREDIVFAVVTTEDDNIRRTADYELFLRYYDDDGWMLVNAIRHQILTVIPLAPPSEDLSFDMVSNLYREYEISLAFEHTNDFHTGRVIHTYNVKRELPLFTSEGSISIVNDFSENTESWSASIGSEDIHSNWNIHGEWTARWTHPNNGHNLHLDMTVIEVADTYIHARGRIWSTEPRLGSFTPTFEMDFDEKLTRVNAHQYAMFWDERAGAWSEGDSDYSYLIALPLVNAQGFSGPVTYTFNVSFWRNDANVSQRGWNPVYTLTRVWN